MSSTEVECIQKKCSDLQLANANLWDENAKKNIEIAEVWRKFADACDANVELKRIITEKDIIIRDFGLMDITTLTQQCEHLTRAYNESQTKVTVLVEHVRLLVQQLNVREKE